MQEERAPRSHTPEERRQAPELPWFLSTDGSHRQGRAPACHLQAHTRRSLIVPAWSREVGDHTQVGRVDRCCESRGPLSWEPLALTMCTLPFTRDQAIQPARRSWLSSWLTLPWSGACEGEAGSDLSGAADTALLSPMNADRASECTCFLKTRSYVTEENAPGNSYILPNCVTPLPYVKQHCHCFPSNFPPGIPHLPPASRNTAGKDGGGQGVQVSTFKNKEYISPTF